jgi:hypothetical protein
LGSGIGSIIGAGSMTPASTAATMSGMDALKYGSMALAPGLMYQPPSQDQGDDTVMPRYDYTAGLTGDYYGTGGDGGTFERRYFTQPTFTRRAAAGGIMQLAEGGETDPKDPARGMTGASAEAMRYLMGQTDTSPAKQAQQRLIQGAPTQAAVPAAALAPGSDRQFMYDQATHSVVRNPNYADPKRRTFGDFLDFEQSFSEDPTRFANLAWTTAFTEGGLASLAKGGMKDGGFVIPADVVSMAGEGNTDAGYERIQRTLPGATPIKGKDGGQADTVKTSIEGKQPARVAHGEMYVPPETVKKAGGAKKLYAMMDKVRKQATGSTKQIKPVKALA